MKFKSLSRLFLGALALVAGAASAHAGTESSGGTLGPDAHAVQAFVKSKSVAAAEALLSKEGYKAIGEAKWVRIDSRCAPDPGGSFTSCSRRYFMSQEFESARTDSDHPFRSISAIVVFDALAKPVVEVKVLSEEDVDQWLSAAR